MPAILIAYTAFTFQILSYLLQAFFFVVPIVFVTFLTQERLHSFKLAFVVKVFEVILPLQIIIPKARQLLDRFFTLLCSRNLKENCLDLPFKVLSRVLFSTTKTSPLNQNSLHLVVIKTM